MGVRQDLTESNGSNNTQSGSIKSQWKNCCGPIKVKETLDLLPRPAKIHRAKTT
jgi:hypothetical protein